MKVLGELTGKGGVRGGGGGWKGSWSGLGREESSMPASSIASRPQPSLILMRITKALILAPINLLERCIQRDRQTASEAKKSREDNLVKLAWSEGEAWLL